MRNDFKIGLLCQAELISYALHCGNIIISDLFPDLADVNINSAVENVNIGAPDMLKEVFPAKNFIGTLGKKE
jgi:hypothetical protein